MQWLHTIIESIELEKFIPRDYLLDVERKIEGVRAEFQLKRELFDSIRR